MTDSISFIIPHMGREEMLAQTLASIAALEITNLSIEIIVVTKNDSLSEEISTSAQKIPLKVINAPMEVSISKQRNMGVDESVGNYLAFLDADIELSPNWLIDLLDIMKQDSSIKLISAVQKNSKNPTPLEKLRTVLSNAKTDCDVEFLPGRNLLIKKETFKSTGGFPEHLITCEDYVFTQSVAKLGRLFYSSKSSYVHIGEDKHFLPMAKKEVWRGLSNIASLKGRKIPVSEIPSFLAPPVFTLGLVLFVVFAMFELKFLSIFCLLSSFAVLILYSFRLVSIAKNEVHIGTIFAFYILYFPARTIGTLKGVLMRKTDL